MPRKSPGYGFRSRDAEDDVELLTDRFFEGDSRAKEKGRACARPCFQRLAVLQIEQAIHGKPAHIERALADLTVTEPVLQLLHLHAEGIGRDEDQLAALQLVLVRLHGLAEGIVRPLG